MPIALRAYKRAYAKPRKNAQRLREQWAAGGVYYRRARFERMESRRMLSTIVWSNRGGPGNDSDFFEATLGSLTAATAGRSVVDRAIAAWERVIVDFNYPFPALPNTHDVNIAFGPNFPGTGALTLPVQEVFGFLVASRITVESGRDTDGDGLGDGAGWFIDPSPNSHAEFGEAITNIDNAFAARASSTSPANNLADLYSVVLHELGHSMGLYPDPNLKIGAFLSDTGVVAGPFGTYWAFEGPSIDHLVTNANAIPFPFVSHTAFAPGSAPNQPVDFNGKQFVGALDLMNPSGTFGTRELIPDTVRLILADAYGYETANPALFGSFYANLDRPHRVLNVFGASGASDDVITISQTGDTVTVSVDLGQDIPATGALPGAGDLPAFISRFDVNDIDEIIVMAGDGDDTISLNSIASGVTVTLDGGAGEDLFDVGGGDIDTRTDTHIIVNGGRDFVADRLIISDEDDTGTDTYAIRNGSFDKSSFDLLEYSGISEVTLNASDRNSTINVTDALMNSVFDVIINARGGDDVLHVGDRLDRIGMLITFDGGSETDTVEVNNTASGAARSFTIDKSSVDADIFGRVDFSDTEALRVVGGGGDDSFDLRGAASGVQVALSGGGGRDTFNISADTQDVDSHFDADVHIQGGPDDDWILVQDAGDTGPDSHIVDGPSYTKNSWTNQLIQDDVVEFFFLQANDEPNSIRVHGTVAGTTLFLDAGGGDDEFLLSPIDRDIDTHLLGEIQIFGGADTDHAIIDDNDDAGALDLYTITDSAVEKGGFGGGSVFGGMRYFSDTEHIQLNANPFDNGFFVQGVASGVTVTVNANDGNDIFSLDNAANLSDTLAGELNLFGESGTNALAINDTIGKTNDDYTLTKTTFTKTGAGLVTFSGMQDLVLRANSGNNDVFVNGAAAGTAVRVEAGPGIDSVAVGGGDIDSNIDGQVTIAGGEAFDTLLVNDGGDALNDDYVIAAAEITKLQTAPILYEGVETVFLQANAFDNTIDVLSTAADAPVVILAGDGNDVVRVSPVTQAFVGFESPITVYGGSGRDDVRFFNQLLRGNQSYRVTRDFITLVDSPSGVVYLEVEEFSLFSGGGADRFDAQNANPATLVALHGAAGDDVFDVLAPEGPLFIDGGPHQRGDTLHFDADGWNAVDDGATITGAGFADVSYVNIENVNVTGEPIDLPLTMTAAEGFAYFHRDGVSHDAQTFSTMVGDAAIDTPDDVDTFYFAGGFLWNGVYTISANATSGDVDPLIAVYDATTGQRLAMDNDSGLGDGARLEISLSSNRRYIVAVADDNREDTGDVELIIDAPTFANPGTVVLDPNGRGTSTAVLSQAVAQTTFLRFTLPGEATGEVTITASPRNDHPDLNTAIVLFDEAGNELGESYLAGPGAADVLNVAGLAPLTTYYVTVLSVDYASFGVADISVHARLPAKSAGRRLFYNDSVFDGLDPAINDSDDAAIAVDKLPLFPGQMATLSNYSGYEHGLNGLMVDILALADRESLSVDDYTDYFEFRIGNDSDAGLWDTAPPPQSIVVRPGAGQEGSDRIAVVWENGAIARRWLQVTVKATEQTGLAAADVFYFGSAPGETGNAASHARVDFADRIAVIQAQNSGPVGVDHVMDLNRDGIVDASDVAVVDAHLTGLDGDLDLDDIVGINDLAIVQARQGSDGVTDPYLGDINGDGRINRGDLAALAALLGQVASEEMLAGRLELISPPLPTIRRKPFPVAWRSSDLHAASVGALLQVSSTERPLISRASHVDERSPVDLGGYMDADQPLLGDQSLAASHQSVMSSRTASHVPRSKQLYAVNAIAKENRDVNQDDEPKPHIAGLTGQTDERNA